LFYKGSECKWTALNYVSRKKRKRSCGVCVIAKGV
jgi:hypothetical protein